jgi:hypothetical protein
MTCRGLGGHYSGQLIWHDNRFVGLGPYVIYKVVSDMGGRRGRGKRTFNRKDILALTGKLDILTSLMRAP